MILPFHVQLSTSCRHDGKGTFYNIFRLNACKNQSRRGGRVGKSDRTVDGSTPTAGNFALRNFGN